MRYLRNCWYQAGWTSDVTRETHLVRVILDQPILFFRKEDGTLAALLDRCPHRFAPLSAGTVENGQVVCGYHGLGFGADGRCNRNPHGPVTSTMRVASYPVAERHAAIWIWMGDPAAADPATIPDLSFIDETPETARLYMTMHAVANYQLLSDNIMDLTHVDYLHPTTLGGMMGDVDMKVRESGDRVIIEWTALDVAPPPAYAVLVNNAPKADIWLGVTWHAPAAMILGAATTLPGVARKPADESLILHSMTPETETTSHYFVCATRPFMQDDVALTEYIREATYHAFIHEDKPMVEKQQARMGTPDLWALNPILLKRDEGGVRVRRKLEKMIAAENELEAVV